MKKNDDQLWLNTRPDVLINCRWTAGFNAKVMDVHHNMQYERGTPLIVASKFIHTESYLIKVCLLVFGAVGRIWERFFASWVLAKVWFLSCMCSEVNLEIFQPRKGLGTTRILHWKRKLHLRICTFSWVNNLWLFMCGAVAFMFVFGPLWRMVHWFKSGYWCM